MIRDAGKGPGPFKKKGPGPWQLVAFAAVATLVSGPVRAETRPVYGGSIEASLLGAPGTFDPVAAQTHAESMLAELVFDGLYRVGPAGTVQPHLAEAMPVLDAAGTTARIAIRVGVTFHDGTVLAASDVAASLERLRGTWVLAAVKSVRADGDAVELALKAPTANLTTLLALPQAAITRRGVAPGEAPVGTGAFRVTKVDRANRKITLAAFEEHFAGRPYLDALALRWYDTPDGEARQFETGAAQLSARGVAAFTGSQPKYRARDVEGPGSVLAYVGFSRKHPDVLGEPAFRRALDLAIARGALTAVSSGERITPVRLPVPLEAGGAGVQKQAGNGELAAAQTALAEAAMRVPALVASKLPALSLEILVDETRPDDKEIGERVLRALDKLGIAATVRATSATAMRDAVAKGTTDLYIGQLAAPATTSWVWWAEAFTAGGSDWAKRELASGSLSTTSAQKEFAAKLPIVPLMFRGVRLWHRTDIRGVAFDASGLPCFADMFLFGSPSRSTK